MPVNSRGSFERKDCPMTAQKVAMHNASVAKWAPAVLGAQERDAWLEGRLLCMNAAHDVLLKKECELTHTTKSKHDCAHECADAFAQVCAVALQHGRMRVHMRAPRYGWRMQIGTLSSMRWCSRAAPPRAGPRSHPAAHAAAVEAGHHTRMRPARAGLG